MKKLIILAFCALMAAVPARAADAAGAEAFAQKLADEIMRDVVKSKTSLEQKQNAFRKIFLSAVNIKSTARFTLGRYARTANPEQLQAYTDALTNNIIYTWTERFNNYAGETIAFNGSRKSDGGDFYVTSKIDIPNTENDVEIIWRIVDKKDELKLADLVVEGVSMLMSYRNEYTSVLQQNGGDIAALVKQLTAKNETLKKPAAK
ncbi:MAG: ABC transporter substrate-binding protein [Alphaproteobacteria bacterium]|nr:ABC transporter substrate-binding protein [Alphaproteobacteria bacterium]